MKQILLLALLFVAPMLQANDSFKLPKKHFTLDQLEEAKAAAASEKKGIAFLYSDKNSTCPLCNAASEEFISTVKSSSVIVYLDNAMLNNKRKEINSANAPLYQSLIKGSYIPKVVVTDAAAKEIISSLGYSEYKADKSKTIRTLRKNITEWAKK